MSNPWDVINRDVLQPTEHAVSGAVDSIGDFVRNMTGKPKPAPPPADPPIDCKNIDTFVYNVPQCGSWAYNNGKWEPTPPAKS